MASAAPTPRTKLSNSDVEHGVQWLRRSPRVHYSAGKGVSFAGLTSIMTASIETMSTRTGAVDMLLVASAQTRDSSWAWGLQLGSIPEDPMPMTSPASGQTPQGACPPRPVRLQQHEGPLRTVRVDMVSILAVMIEPLTPCLSSVLVGVMLGVGVAGSRYTSEPRSWRQSRRVVGAGVRHAWRLHPSCWTLYSTSVLLDIVFGLDTELGVIRGDIPKFMPPCRAWCTCAGEILPTTTPGDSTHVLDALSMRNDKWQHRAD
ncbi:hypothetical protein PHYSODRAFT_324194 [Phytophthora sojae]|uniref:Uncharacterized protein n=1 Tax=Phytophthora sojae (strain P6497) TaxID=1094619 RepID=G4YRG7_PHYSP|nr:hypothetical protein PHYSODRAFT_324194 [Phytophthora sojae]EGZ22901.1 hypothetical protein PHYSODRAFT_324194 [Phytophthora sojae]|eukprot:XP_009518189.1 hypothetical protein PHYSODRAFT_324194 [Phytophthora sojae]